MANGNGSGDPEDLHLRYLNLHNEFTACQARSHQAGDRQVKLLQSLQQEIVRFETDVAKKLIDLKKDVHLILEHITHPDMLALAK